MSIETDSANRRLQRKVKLAQNENILVEKTIALVIVHKHSPYRKLPRDIFLFHTLELISILIEGIPTSGAVRRSTSSESVTSLRSMDCAISFGSYNEKVPIKAREHNLM
jgi:hypothetical protein